jgi:hypothetical protein
MRGRWCSAFSLTRQEEQGFCDPFPWE